jgi:hypothetical protein
MRQLAQLDIGTADHVMLSALSFEGATKRMKPDVVNGDLILCRLIVPNKDMEPEVSYLLFVHHPIIGDMCGRRGQCSRYGRMQCTCDTEAQCS